MDFLTLAGTVVSVLSPYLIKGGEKFAAEVGNAAFQKVKILWGKLTQQFHDDKATTKVLSDFQDKPKRNASILADILQQEMQEHEDFAAELKKTLNDIGPSLEIIQEFDEAKDLIGIRVAKFRKGSAKIEQRGNRIQSGTGAEIDEFG